MSTRANVKDFLRTDILSCAICDDREWSAMWSGRHPVGMLCVCRTCAIEVLPRLIADAVWSPCMQPSQANAIVDQIRAEFWRALALCSMRDRSRSIDDGQQGAA